MKQFTLILIAATVGLAACRTETQQTAAMQPLPKDKRLTAVYKKLKAEPVPTPNVTPFDADIRLCSWSRAGFTHGYYLAASDLILKPSQIIPPAGIPSDCLPAWEVGAQEGARTGQARVLAKLEEKR